MNKSTIIRVLITLFVLSGFAAKSYAQQIDWSDYQRLKAVGKIPEIFNTTTEEKINADQQKSRIDMSEHEKADFLEHIHYSLDELLGSGLVLFGDPCTEYVRKVAGNLLKNEGQLKKELEFYVIKSNLTNALSTDQGVIFVTLGLLAQVENEAQLAYVLSHEIAHFQEKHVEESFTNSNSLRVGTTYDARIRALSNHSKESELEADKMGIKLYHAAGYKKSELLSAFDVLMYSYLPFDEVELPKTYFNSDLLFVPEKYFPEKINPILADEDYDDEKSSHPNIRKRKTAIKEEIKSYENWGDKLVIIDQSEFEKVRKIARFEGVHRDLIDCRYADALYSIFLLEQEDANSLFLNRSKAKAWLGLVSFKNNGNLADAVSNPTDVEGESHAMHFLLRKFTKLQLMTIAMRQIEDAAKSFPDDEEIALTRKRMIRLLASYSSFKTEKYRRINYQTALERFERSKEELMEPPVEEDIAEDTNAVLSKYDKIRQKRESEDVEAVSEDEEFNEEEFYLYALSDIIGDDSFEAALNAAMNEIKEEEEETDRWRSLSRAEKKQEEKANRYLGLTELIMMNPLAVQYYYGEALMKESAELERMIRESMLENAERLDMKMHNLANSELNTLTTEQYNRQALMVDFLRQKSSYEGEEMFPVDYSELKTVKTKAYNGCNVLFTLANFQKTAATRNVSLIFLIMDMENGEVEKEYTYQFRTAPKKAVLNSYVYDAINGMGVKKGKKK